jgi:hypothetical protein
MAQSYPDVIGSQNWQDIIAIYPAIAARRVVVQAKGGTFNYIHFGGAVAPRPGDGLMLPSVASANGTADHIWVRGDCRFAIMAED